MAEARLTMPGLVQRKRDGIPLVMLTCYDASFARAVDALAMAGLRA